MEQTNQAINTTIPLWGIITMIAIPTATAIWNGIKLYFDSEAMKKLQKEDRKCIEHLEKRIEVIRDKATFDLEEHKKATSNEFIRLNTKLDSQGTTLTRVETMVGLLVKNKIKD